MGHRLVLPESPVRHATLILHLEQSGSSNNIVKTPYGLLPEIRTLRKYCTRSSRRIKSIHVRWTSCWIFGYLVRAPRGNNVAVPIFVYIFLLYLVLIPRQSTRSVVVQKTADSLAKHPREFQRIPNSRIGWQHKILGASQLVFRTVLCRKLEKMGYESYTDS